MPWRSGAARSRAMRTLEPGLSLIGHYLRQQQGRAVHLSLSRFLSGRSCIRPLRIMFPDFSQSGCVMSLSQSSGLTSDFQSIVQPSLPACGHGFPAL